MPAASYAAVRTVSVLPSRTANARPSGKNTGWPGAGRTGRSPLSQDGCSSGARTGKSGVIAGSQPGAVATSRTSAVAVRNARSPKTAEPRVTGAPRVPVSPAEGGSAARVTVDPGDDRGVPSGAEPVTVRGGSV